ncbi:hypothetical protein FB45DRAFT_374604 [Roridomyces roridus]|uniref:Uncharacterized protein n=1 Tax=Roridomyces roridus TaxID=1738132 RepID=A0AAD7F8N5_9AGAR|nr:hypothetical protein FB45DRAFT_374604 [Roridomyces roridus]
MPPLSFPIVRRRALVVDVPPPPITAPLNNGGTDEHSEDDSEDEPAANQPTSRTIQFPPPPPAWTRISVAPSSSSSTTAITGTREITVLLTETGSPSASAIDSTPTSTQTAAQDNAGETSQPAQRGGSQSHAGEIAGGVLGGLVFLLLVGAGTFWFLCRRRRRFSTTPSPQFVTVLPPAAFTLPVAVTIPESNGDLDQAKSPTTGYEPSIWTLTSSRYATRYP